MSVKHRRQPPAMATVNHLSFLTIITLILSVQSNPNLHPTDHKALLSLHNHLHIPTTISTTAGIFSEQTTTTTTTVLRVTRIILPNRRLKGSISPSIGNLTELKQLILSNNHLINQIPIQISTCRNLEILDLHNNRLSGQVPVDLSSLTHLRILDLSFNKLTGDLHFIKYFPNLETLSLNNNMFTGKIPISLKLFRNLILFNISGNSFLEYPFPVLNQLESHNKKSNKNKKNDKDNNLLNKVVPKRYSFAELDTRNETRDERNKLDDVMAPGPSPTSAPVRKHGEKKKKKVVRWILGFVAGAVGGIICGAIVSVLFKMVLNLIKGKKSDSGVAIFSQQIKAEELAFLESEEGVAGLQIIGKGGCGEVYKTELLLSKVKTIAVKKIVQPPKDAAELTEEDTKLLNKKMRQIKSEIQTVGQIRHRNLVPLLAHVSRPNCHYLVYEFMKNGSLQDILQQVKDGSRELDWLARHRIALGVAAGLEYLHMSHTPRIVHRDLKPANVLLDDDMEARIADFGLAKSIPDADTHMTSSNVAGTLGYIAPEYHQTLKFTDKCDIYSFGVVLAVLVMGKLPSDEFFQRTSEMNMVKWLRNVMTSEDPKQAIDPKLMGNGHEEQMLLVLKIACFCTLDNPKERPNSKDVRLMLAQIIH